MSGQLAALKERYERQLNDPDPVLAAVAREQLDRLNLGRRQKKADQQRALGNRSQQSRFIHTARSCSTWLS